ncbi:MAG TPA: glycerol kinase GlpK [Microbacteriaceae bacterium]|nr:glycerol kinase GlpK [Microbacteriaceae bacterium]
MNADHVLSIDQGTTSTRAIVFDRTGAPVATGQLEHRQILPEAGWVEHDALEILANTRECVATALARAGLSASRIAAVGITNQRETTVVWDRATGRPLANAIVWQDTRTQDLVDAVADGDPERFRVKTGLPLASYFSASKIRWLLDAIPGAQGRAERGELAFGTIDSWLLWQLTGGPDGGVHATDVTNASRTLLLDLTSLDWDDELLDAWGVPRALLPSVRSSSEVYGAIADGALAGVPVAGILGDQQAATFGQAAFSPGESKMTYGTGGFLIINTGGEQIHSSAGLVTTVAYRIGDEPASYALEGSIAVAGSLIQWLRDNLGIIKSSAEAETLAMTVEDSGDVYFVPAFSGLFAPYWRPDARGAIVGLTRYSTKAHIARAALESTAFQTLDVVVAASKDDAGPPSELRVDGGMSVNDRLMQFQADLLGAPIVRPAVIETTALGAAYAAGLAVGLWRDLDELRANWRAGARFVPEMSAEERERRIARWHRAVEKSLDWID